MKLQYETTGGTIRHTREVKKIGVSDNKCNIDYESIDGKLLFTVSIFEGFHYASNRLVNGVVVSNNNGRFRQIGIHGRQI